MASFETLAEATECAVDFGSEGLGDFEIHDVDGRIRYYTPDEGLTWLNMGGPGGRNL